MYSVQAEEILDFNLGDTKSRIWAHLVNKFSRKIHLFSRSSHQEISWKLPGATNLYLQENLVFS